MRIEETIAELERVAAREVGRGSEALAAPAAGGLTAIVRAGAVDGVRRRPTLSVDGLDWPAYAEPLTRIAELVRAGR
ncbi:hypothetical protein ACIA47_27195 [Micromonospora sp. NPDC051227]|uniref:hypothetical protein n=1 Tax=Micromonospora sp. NPDC051227 TaxID=3364285 RepID=UPI0037AF6A1D